MTLSCAGVRDRFTPYALDELSKEERRAFREHLSECPSCRSEAEARDPVLRLARPVPESVSADEAVRVLEAVRAGIALKQAEGRLEKPARRRWGALASAAAAVALTLLVPGAMGRRQAPPAPAPREAAVPGFAPATVRAPAGKALEKAGEAGRYPADATIYDWNPGAGQPRVVWIVDRSIDI